MQNMNSLPLTVRRAIELMGIYFLGMIIIVGKDVINPLVMAFFLAVMILPVYRWFRKRKLPETLSIGLSLLIIVIIVGLVVWFFSSQISRLVADFPQIRANVTAHLNSFSSWLYGKTGLSTERQTQIIAEQNDKVLNYAGTMLGGAASSVTGVLVFVGLLPIYIFLMLFYKNLLLRFMFLWFTPDTHTKVEEVMRETEIIIKSYLVGLLIQITYITVLLGAILFFISIKHALLIGAILPRTYEVYDDRLVLVFGFSRWNIGMDSIEVAREAKPHQAYAYNGVRFATKPGEAIELRRVNSNLFTRPNLIISPDDRSTFLVELNTALSRYRRLHGAPA